MPKEKRLSSGAGDLWHEEARGFRPHGGVHASAWRAGEGCLEGSSKLSDLRALLRSASIPCRHLGGKALQHSRTYSLYHISELKVVLGYSNSLLYVFIRYFCIFLAFVVFGPVKAEAASSGEALPGATGAFAAALG